jgi:allantoin racemase
MSRILLINPNTSSATTDMMVEIAQSEMAPGFRVQGITAQEGVPMIINEAELDAAALEVRRSWLRAGRDWAGVIVSAFGDPGIELLRAATRQPVVGICEASMLEAAGKDRRRFGVATVTPDLADAIEARAGELGLGRAYTGIRLTQGPPRELAADPGALERALAQAVTECIEKDGAEAVIIGGGPLGQAATRLASGFKVPIIAPIPAAVRRLLSQLRQEPAIAAAP